MTNLWLNNNQLTSLPPEILNISPRVNLVVHSNRICSIPDSIEAWLDRYAQSNWRQTQDCSCLDTNYLEYGTDAPCLTLIVYGCMHPDYAEYNPEANVADLNACITLGVGKGLNKSGELTIHHNPFSNSITINFPYASEDKSLSIYTLKGKLVKKFETDNNSITWYTQGNERGVYYIRAVVDGKNVVRRIVL
jgi:Leucine-rich repeat (LRR) protein